MPTDTEVKQANPEHLSANEFLVNLAVTFGVENIPLAIFIFICVLLGCILFLFCVAMIVQSCIQRRFIPPRKRKPHKTIYEDEIPGVAKQNVLYHLGEIEYSIEYDIQRSTMKLGVIKASNLVAPNNIDVFQAYVTLRLRIEKEGRRMNIGRMQRTAKKQGDKPYWKEYFAYKIEAADLRHIVCNFTVYAFDTIRQDSSIGQLSLRIADVDPSEYCGGIYEKNVPLSAGETAVSGIGQLCIGIANNTNKGQIEITVLEAKQLELTELLPTSKKYDLDFFIEVKANNKSIGSQATQKKTDIVSPYFNEKLAFPIKSVDVKDIGITCSLRSKKRMGGMQPLGQIQIGCESEVSTGVKQWEDMSNVPNVIHTMWHAIIPVESAYIP